MRVPEEAAEREEYCRKMALGLLKGNSGKLACAIEESGMRLSDFFALSMEEVRSALSMRKCSVLTESDRQEALVQARKLAERMSGHNVEGLYIADADYPQRLAEAPDAPALLFKLGDADLNGRHVLNLVGTRRSTPYGTNFCKKLIEDLSAYFPDLTVVSGLAYGIDGAAHAAAMECGLPTVAVVAHGLDMVYPAQHRDLARTIVKNGGAIVSEYPYGVRPYPQRFLERNRIIAALSDLTIVVESDVKGGAMSTANSAFSYSREVMALPGKITDASSSGCNWLIKKQKASLISGAADVIELMGWQPMGLNVKQPEPTLFPELTGDVALIYETLRQSEGPMQADRLHALTKIPAAELAGILGEMEFDGLITRHAGNRYSL